MDYRDLLLKYIRYVEDVEGITYLEHYSGYPGDQEFTPEEWAELQRLDMEPRERG